MLRMPCATQCSANLADDWFAACCTLSFLCCADSLSCHVCLKWTQHGVQLTDFANSSWGKQEYIFSYLFSNTFLDVFIQKTSISLMVPRIYGFEKPQPLMKFKFSFKFAFWNHLSFEISHLLQFPMTFFAVGMDIFWNCDNVIDNFGKMIKCHTI